MTSHRMDTLCTHAGLHVAGSSQEPTAPAIPQNTAWAFRSMEDAEQAFAGKWEGGFYARLGTPLHHAIETSLAQMEACEGACLFSTGMAAMSAALDVLVPTGGTVVCSRDVYGSTEGLLDAVGRERGVRVLRVNMADDAEYRAALAQRPQLVVMEIVANPTLRVFPLDVLAKQAHDAGALVLVDSTFTPAPILRAAELGADVVHHSAAKSLSGHGDVMAGVLLGRSHVVEKLRQRRALVGAHLGAMEAWLLGRGMRTLHLRVKQAGLNALHVAHHLEHRRARGKLPAVTRVVHPALPGHPGGDWLLKNSGGHAGMMVCVDLAAPEMVSVFVRSLRNIPLVPSLGETATTIAVPARSSHRAVSAPERVARGITDTLVRISVGMEDAQDVVEDLEQALQACARGA